MAKHFAGGKIRTLRHARNLTQAQMARSLGISTSYLNQLENDQRPLTVSVLVQLAGAYDLDPTYFSDDAERRTVGELASLLPSISEPVLTDIAVRFPAVAEAILSVPELLAGSALNPYVAVRNFFQSHRNYFHELDTHAEDLARSARGRQRRLTQLAATFDQTLGYTVRFNQDTGGSRSAVDPALREIRLRTGLTEAQQCFELAYHYCTLTQASLIDAYLHPAFTDPEARAIAHHGLAQYFAAAVTMPYAEILEAAETSRYDIEVISARFGTSFESTCQRLGTLQRPGATAVPFFFIRTDRAGNISKRQSTTSFPFAISGGTCPLWVIHRAFDNPGSVIRQVSTMPDDTTHLWVARMVQGPTAGFGTPRRENAVALGCDISHAHRLVYADGLDLSLASATPIGPGCDTCPRMSCPQRAFPAVRV
ncbi:anaerobic benzoate catabolism transcriptional regulator [Corynebacterium capitovis DSM 44611]|uniref:helix-turn-helix domain-containing protein n=1 Tax=Corynebacterium capitovis TaxID=131081 RepID=UPI00036B419C|nr:short-chain fatty acyl-CoA regulator family protein [Corynebacterium capitovis]WKD56978.1 anaerobic benzoate catabolism transcriptional regulator [Corynebacterium capitovis DSM 44611]